MKKQLVGPTVSARNYYLLASFISSNCSEINVGREIIFNSHIIYQYL